MVSNEELRSYLSIFSESFKSALSRQFLVDVEKSSSKNDFQDSFVTSYIELDYQRIKGQIRLHMTNDCLIKLYNEALGEDIDELNEENLDFSGEVMNILYCLSKDRLINEKYLPVESEIPVTKQGLKILPDSVKEYYQCEYGQFIIEIFEVNWATRMAI